MKPGMSISLKALAIAIIISLGLWYVAIRAVAYWVIVSTGWLPFHR